MAIKYKFKNELENLITKIKNNKNIKKNKIDIDKFQHNLYSNVASKFLIKYYKSYKKMNVKTSFKDFVNNKCKDNKMKICQYIKDKLDSKVTSQKNINLNSDLNIFTGGMYIDNYSIKCKENINSNNNNIICLFHKNDVNDNITIEDKIDQKNIQKIINTNPLNISLNKYIN